jgi:hypothetical protein
MKNSLLVVCLLLSTTFAVGHIWKVEVENDDKEGSENSQILERLDRLEKNMEKILKIVYQISDKQSLKKPTLSINTNQMPNASNEIDLIKKWNGKKYKVLTTESQGSREYQYADYNGAVLACQASNPKSTILTITSQEENEFVTNWLFNDLKITSQVWLAMKRIDETCDFIWDSQPDSSASYRHWHKCEPNCFTSNDWPENCVEMYSHIYPYPLRCDVEAKAGDWNDIPCTGISNVIVCKS